jgi:hypothetical protein
MEQSNETPNQGSDRRGAGHDGHIIGMDRRRPLMRLDFTLNIPTILSLLATVVALVSSGITLYNGLDKRQMTTEFKIDKLDQRVEKNETAVVNLREEQSKREATLRAEMKGDVAEIKDLLNRLYYGPSVNQRTQQRELNEWRK